MPRKSTKRKSTTRKSTNGSAELEFPSELGDLTTIEDYLRTGECGHKYQGGAIVCDMDDSFLCRDGEFLQLSDTLVGLSEPLTEELLSEAGDRRGDTLAHDGTRVDIPAGVMVPGGPKGWRNTLLIGGDGVVSIGVNESAPAITVSFLCLGRFVGDAKPLELVAMLHGGKIKVLDFTKDETRAVSAADKKKREAKKPVFPPENGFTYLIISDVWHRAATVLLRYGRMRILLGQDDGTYFGCELKGAPNTVKEAFKSLIPEHIRKVKGVKRQGEWFVVPVAKKNVPAVTECAAMTKNGIDLPVDDEDSARHTVSSTDIRIRKDGRIYATKVHLRHDAGNHPNIEMPEGWYTFDRNTAVRSFSQEGVD